MVESLINYWTVEHFLFGIATGIIVLIISRSKYRVPVMSFFIFVLYEMFELKQWPNYWIENYLNNLMDIIAGSVGAAIVILLWNRFTKK